MLAKEKKGITLIALVITIIILLILAGITLSALMGENGLIENTKTSIDRYKRSRAEEKVTLAVNASFGVGGDLEYQGEDSTLVNNLKNVNGIDKSTVPNPITQFPFTVVVDGYDIDVNWTTKTGDTENIPSIPDDPDDIPDENDDEDLPPSKPLEDFKDYIPIYTEEQYTKIATEEKGYVITDLTGKTIGSYDMNKDAKYVLMNDITFKTEHISIDEFKGTLEGNGYRIYNLTIKDSYGMFNILSGATLNNISLHNMNVSSQTNLGLIAGSSENTSLNNCYLVDSTGATVLTKDANGKNLPHGIAGFVGDAKEGTNIKKGKVIRSTLTSDTTGYYISAVVGQTSGTTTVEGISVLGTTGNPESYKTGIVENANATTIVKDCHVQNIGFLDCYSRTGGIISVARDADLIVDSCTVKNINAQTKWFAGIISDAYDETKTKTIEIKNCKISDFIAEGYDIGEFISLCQNYNSLKISNSTIKDSEGYSQNSALMKDLSSINEIIVENVIAKNITMSDGIISLVRGKCENIDISNCFIKNSDLSNNSSSNVAGIIGEIQGATKINIDRCGVSETKIGNSKNYGEVAAIVGMSSGELSISNCYATNNELMAYSGTVAGIIGYQTGKLDIRNCKTEGCKISSTDTGGIIALFSGKEINIENCKSLNNNIASTRNDPGGIAGEIWGNNSIKISKCTSQDNIITLTNGYSSSAGGILGLSHNDIEISECIVSGGSIEDFSNESSCWANGILGYGTSGGTITKCNVSNIEKLKSSGGGATGIGTIYGTIENCTVKNITEISGSTIVSGIGAFCESISDCVVEDSNISGKEQVGGIIGYTPSNKNLSNNTVRRCKIEKTDSSMGNIGGIAGTLSGSEGSDESWFNNNNVYDTDIIMNSTNIKYALIGGLVGYHGQYDRTVKNSTANNVNLIVKKPESVTGTLATPSFNEENTSFVVGGIVGLAKGNVDSCLFVGSSITSELDSFFGMGGIVGVGADKEISNCTVDNSTITGDSGIGGICSVAAQKITNCEFKNSTIEATGDYIGGIQGIAGAKTETANWATEMNGCKVTNSTIKAPISTDKDDEHYILQGKNSYYTSESTVEDADKKYDAFTNCTVTDVTRIEK